MKASEIMKAKLILELEGKQYDLRTKDINIFIQDNYITVWTSDKQSFDIKMIRNAKDEN